MAVLFQPCTYCASHGTALLAEPETTIERAQYCKEQAKSASSNEDMLHDCWIWGKFHLDNYPPGCSNQLSGGVVGPVLRLKVSRVAVAEVAEAEACWDISHKS